MLYRRIKPWPASMFDSMIYDSSGSILNITLLIFIFINDLNIYKCTWCNCCYGQFYYISYITLSCSTGDRYYFSFVIMSHFRWMLLRIKWFMNLPPRNINSWVFLVTDICNYNLKFYQYVRITNEMTSKMFQIIWI
jgi:hypothetical protein